MAVRTLSAAGTHIIIAWLVACVKVILAIDYKSLATDDTSFVGVRPSCELSFILYPFFFLLASLVRPQFMSHSTGTAAEKLLDMSQYLLVFSQSISFDCPTCYADVLQATIEFAPEVADLGILLLHANLTSDLINLGLLEEAQLFHHSLCH